MRLYVAGPMTSIHGYNWDAFSDAAFHLRQNGDIVLTPFDSSSRVYHRHFGREFDPFHDVCDYRDPLLREFFADDVAALLSCNRVVLLDGWRDSKGAVVECRIAQMFGLEVVEHSTGLVITHRNFAFGFFLEEDEEEAALERAFNEVFPPPIDGAAVRRGE